MITITKTKRFFMGALVGALILAFFNETKGKQHVNRGYDSESGTTILKNPLKRRVFAFLHPDSSSNEFDHSQNFTYPLPPQQTLTQPIKARSALPPLPFLSPVSSV
ncbi:hypothetical protein FQO85_22240 [Salmonella enterica]|uniref:Uncharacterized protein n=1 Tax=Salmonella houtenae TaxID=59205 RepID=A0A609YRK8_SALHO|nr:hypothetical protein [Salmonella enterica]ECC1598058.1 hypothetical protein [Salmonella enterica subsp. houtenae]EDV4888705.1 hypothetical protein [Salmonella enterica subsp. enterica]HAE3153406.1 hypothetical protein [Salmonella enterica subsp. houtenae serovar 50:g,z51:-]HAE7577390.1 hypothetical protein [Salmonella enterica subsp. houtenae serovar 48:g,z51:-]